MDGEYTGTYRDYDYTLWKWNCSQPEEIVPEDKSTAVEFELPTYSNYEDKTMEWVLWVTYLSQELWVPGWLVSLPVGMGYTFWLLLLSSWQFIETFSGKGTLGEWAAGPFLSYWIVQPFIFWSSIIFSIIPGVNFITAFLFGWWANLDYYQYQYELFGGPKKPEA